jgi:hypothetical protein
MNPFMSDMAGLAGGSTMIAHPSEITSLRTNGWTAILIVKLLYR